MREPRPDWYVDKKSVRPITNFSWTPHLRHRVFKLRQQGKSVDTILQTLNLLGKVSKVPVYNIIKCMSRFSEGRCIQCGEVLKKKDIVGQDKVHYPKCLSCREENSIYKREKRRANLKKGICGICGKRKKMKGYTTCKLCLSSDYRRSYLEHKCGRCHKNPISEKSISFCTSCLKINRKNTARYREYSKCK